MKTGTIALQVSIAVPVVVVSALCLHGCSGKTEDAEFPPVPDYADAGMWYESSYGEGEQSALKADVFYVAPTCIWDWKDGDGNVCHVMNVEDEGQREKVASSMFLGESLFGGDCRFYSPYYRQITMESWMEPEETIEERYATAHRDVVSAFRYYMDNMNCGRPFFLAGHSQGAKAVIELLKHTLTEGERARLLACYAFGFNVTGEELEEYPSLKPAEGATDLGVLVCYNSVSSPEAVSPAFADTEVCINPVNWSVDETPAPASMNPGSVFFNDDRTSDTLFRQVGAVIDEDIHAVVINGLNDEDYFIPSVASLFPKGNYHIYEINLYFLSLQQNIRDRIEAYCGRGGQGD